MDEDTLSMDGSVVVDLDSASLDGVGDEDNDRRGDRDKPKEEGQQDDGGGARKKFPQSQAKHLDWKSSK